MKKRYMIFLLIVFISFCSCSNTNKREEHDETVFYYELTPIDMPEDKIYYYNDDYFNINFSLKVNNTDCESLGLFVFLDGIPQLYTIDVIPDNESYLNTININSNDDKMIFNICFKPNTGIKDDLLLLDFLLIENPNQLITKEEIDGYNQSGMESLYLKMNRNSEKEIDIKPYEIIDSKPISKELLEQNELPNGKNLLDFADFFEFYEENGNVLINVQNDIAKFYFKVYGTTKDNCKTFLFVNHNPVKINNEYDYLKYNLTKNEEKSFEGYIDLSSLEEYNYIYTINIYNRPDALGKTNFLLKSTNFIFSPHNSIISE